MRCGRSCAPSVLFEALWHYPWTVLSRGLLVLATLALISCVTSSWERAVERANDQDKLLIVEFYATWCGPCKWFEKEVLSDPEVRSTFERRVEFKRYDYDSHVGRRHARRLGVSGVPSIVAVDRSGEAFRLLSGAVGKEKLLRFVDWTHSQVYPAGP